MNPVRSTLRLYAIGLLAALAVSAVGCSGGPKGPPPPLPLEDRDGVVAALPKGVTLESAVVANPLYASAKTVEDALKHLRARVKDKVLVDALGHEIHFDTRTGTKAGQKATKKLKGGSTVIVLAH
jgi:hypothetical protein